MRRLLVTFESVKINIMKQSAHKQKLRGLSLEKFATAKQSGYDKKAKKAKELALNAKKVNKYRKLKQRLASQGLLAPRLNYEAEVGPAAVY